MNPIRLLFSRRRPAPLPADVDVTAGCERLRAAIADAHQPGSTAWLEQLYHTRPATRRNTGRRS